MQLFRRAFMTYLIAFISTQHSISLLRPHSGNKISDGTKTADPYISAHYYYRYYSPHLYCGAHLQTVLN